MVLSPAVTGSQSYNPSYSEANHRNAVCREVYGLEYRQLRCLVALLAIEQTTPGLPWALATELTGGLAEINAQLILKSLEDMRLVECRRDIGAPYWYRVTRAGRQRLG